MTETTKLKEEKKQPLISVIVPVYNVEKYIHQCVDSILAQTYKNLEIILVDDGSPDNCPQICDDYASKDSRIKVIHKENGGLSSARNAALDIYNGDYIAFVDSDDWVDSTAYETMMEMMQSKNLDVVFCAANIIVGNEITEVKFDEFESGTIVSPEKMVELTLLDEIGGQVWKKICSRHCWDGVRFPIGRLYEDISISFYPFVNARKNIGFLSAPLYNYRMNENGISLSYNPKKAYHIFLGFQEHYAYAREYCKSVEDGCLAKALYSAVGTYNGFLTNDGIFDASADVKKWMSENKAEIRKCKKIELSKRLQALAIVDMEIIYKSIYSIYRRLRRRK